MKIITDWFLLLLSAPAVTVGFISTVWEAGYAAGRSAAHALCLWLDR